MLDGPQVGTLVKILSGRFTPGGFSMAVFTKLNVQTFNLAPQNATFEVTIYQTVMHFDQTGALGSFLNAMIASNPDPDLPGLLNPFVAAAPQPNLLPVKLQSLTVGTNPIRPFVNRSNLRSLVDHVCQPNNDWRVLSLNGADADPCGKTYSWEFIREIAGVIGRKPVYVDLITGNYNLLEACRAITRRLGLSWEDIKDQFQDQPKPERVAIRFWQELRVLAEKLSTPCWLVLDGLSDPNIDKDIPAYLIPRLLAEVAIDPLPNIFPFLLGDNATRVPQVRNLALHDHVSPFTQAEVEAYVDGWTTERGGSFQTPQDRMSAIADVMTVPPAMEPRMRLFTISDNLLKLLQKLGSLINNAN